LETNALWSTIFHLLHRSRIKCVLVLIPPMHLGVLENAMPVLNPCQVEVARNSWLLYWRAYSKVSDNRYWTNIREIIYVTPTLQIIVIGCFARRWECEVRKYVLSLNKFLAGVDGNSEWYPCLRLWVLQVTLAYQRCLNTGRVLHVIRCGYDRSLGSRPR
jgi:hypothetical protein